MIFVDKRRCLRRQISIWKLRQMRQGDDEQRFGGCVHTGVLETKTCAAPPLLTQRPCIRRQCLQRCLTRLWDVTQCREQAERNRYPWHWKRIQITHLKIAPARTHWRKKRREMMGQIGDAGA